MTDKGAGHDLEQLIASACCLVAVGEDVGSITVVANRRLTYRELARLRDHAAHCRVAIAMQGDGTVTVRRGAVAESPTLESRQSADETWQRPVRRYGEKREHGS